MNMPQTGMFVNTHPAFQAQTQEGEEIIVPKDQPIMIGMVMLNRSSEGFSRATLFVTEIDNEKVLLMTHGDLSQEVPSA